MTEEPHSLNLPLLPASFFGIVLGLAGLATDWRVAHAAWFVPAAIGETVYAVGFVAWLIIVVLFACKWMMLRAAAKEEANHAVQCCFIGLAGVATMLIGQGALPYSRPLALVVSVAGAAFTLFFALWRTGILWRGDREASATTPVLYLPTVAGGFVMGTVSAGLGWNEWAQMSFGMGFFSWLAIESVLVNRLYITPLAPALRATLGIQLAPPAVGLTCYLSIGGHSDLFAHMLIGYALLQALLLMRMVRWIMEQPFGASYWAFTFGATALAGASIRLSIEEPAGVFSILAPVLFILANVLILSIAAGTVRLLIQGRLLPTPVAVPAAPTASGV